MPILIPNDVLLILVAILFIIREQRKAYRNGRDDGYDEGWDDAKADTFCYFDQEDSTLVTTDLDQFHREQEEWMIKQLGNRSPQQDGSEQ